MNIKTKKIFSFLIITTFICGNIFYIENATAITDDDEEKLEDAQDELEKLDEKAAAYEKIILLKKKEQTLLGQKINNLNSEIQKTKKSIQENIKTIDELNAQIESLTEEIIENGKLIKVQKDLLSKVLRSYHESDAGFYAKIIMNVKTFAGFSGERDRLSQTSDKITEITSSLKALQKELEEKETLLIDKKNKLIDERDELESKNAKLNSVKVEKNTILVQTRGDEVKYQGKLSEVEAKKRAIEEEIDLIEDVKSSNINYSKLPPIKKGYFTYPVNPVRITQAYGSTNYAKYSGIYKNNFHNGLDFGISYSQVYAAKDGKVESIGSSKYAYGKWVAINHDDGLVTLYGHLSDVNVSRGEKVKEGEKIGISGNTGTSTGPHLHFSVFAEDTFEITSSKYVSGLRIPTGGSVNPNRYLK